MSKYQPIGKEISIESMRYMREEEHMTNKEIAELSAINRKCGQLNVTPEMW